MLYGLQYKSKSQILCLNVIDLSPKRNECYPAIQEQESKCIHKTHSSWNIQIGTDMTTDMTTDVQANFFIWTQFHIYITPYVLFGKCTWERISLYAWSISDNHSGINPQTQHWIYSEGTHNCTVVIRTCSRCIENLLGVTTAISLFNVIAKYDLSI